VCVWALLFLSHLCDMRLCERLCRIPPPPSKQALEQQEIRVFDAKLSCPVIGSQFSNHLPRLILSGFKRLAIDSCRKTSTDHPSSIINETKINLLGMEKFIRSEVQQN
jgi:hypothetical protein